MKSRLKILVLPVVLAGFFSLTDYLYSNLQDVSGFKAEGLYYMYQSLICGQLVYLTAGLAYGIMFLLAILLLKLLFNKILQDQKQIFSLEISVFFGIFIFLLLTAIAPSGNKWRIFVNSSLFAVLAIITGAGIKFLWDRFLNDFLGGPIKSAYILFQALLLSASLIMFWILKLPSYDRAKVYMSIVAGLIFVIAVLFARAVLEKKSAMLKAGYLVFLLAGLCLPLFSYRTEPPKPLLGKPEKPLNIIFIIADACRYDSLGINGGEVPTPNLDRLGKEGIIFRNAYSNAPWTVPSMLSMTSSLYPAVFQSISRFGTSYSASPKVEFFAERLRTRGYHTIAVNANNILGKRDLTLMGFDKTHIIEYRYRLQRLRYYRVIWKIHYLFRRFLGLTQLPDTTAKVTEKGEQFLKENPTPFFLYLHYMNPHDPYNPPAKYLKDIKYTGALQPPFYPTDPFHQAEDRAHPQEMDIKLGLFPLGKEDKRFIKELYLGNVRYLDEKIGELMETVRELGLEENTVVIFTADHGEAFWEHEQWSHGHCLYDELLHIPLIFWGAGLKPGVVESQVSMIDMVPTLAEMLGIEPNPVWRGKSFYPVLKDPSYQIQPKPIFAEGTRRPEEMKAIRSNEYKLIVGKLTGKKQLFNLKDDPAEQKNIWDENPELAQELEEELNLWQAQNQALKNKLLVRELTPEERKEFEERLRAAGYIK